MNGGVTEVAACLANELVPLDLVHLPIGKPMMT